MLQQMEEYYDKMKDVWGKITDEQDEQLCREGIKKTTYANYTQQWPHGRSPPTATFLGTYHLHDLGPPSKRPSQPRTPQKRRHFLPYRLRTNITPFDEDLPLMVHQRYQEEMLIPQSGSISTPQAG